MSRERLPKNRTKSFIKEGRAEGKNEELKIQNLFTFLQFSLKDAKYPELLSTELLKHLCTISEQPHDKHTKQ